MRNRPDEFMSADAIAQTDAPSPIDDLADDLLHGAAAIGAYIGVDERRAFYLLSKGYIPATKAGASWIGSKRRLRRYFSGGAA